MQYIRFSIAAALLIFIWVHASEPLREDGELDWRWGMDFKGGVQLVYKLNPDYLEKKGLTIEEIKPKLNESRVRLRKRVLSFHTAESRIALLGEDRLLVEIPGVDDIDKVREDIGRPQFITIRGIEESSPDPPANDDPERANWFRVPKTKDLYPHPLEGSWVRLSPPGCTGEHILYDKFEAAQKYDDGWAFPLPLNQEGQDSFAKFTTEFKGRDTAILLDDRIQPNGILRVQAGGLRKPSITTNSPTDATQLIKLLRSGPLPLPFVLHRTRKVSPVLAATRDTSLRALGVGVIVLILFFGFNYLHRPYFLLVTLGAVALEVGLFITVANLGWVRISLPQLAGLALLIGMSVDAFILVFEHIEQEVQAEREPGGVEPDTPEALSSLQRAIRLSQQAFATEFGVIFWASATTVLSLGGLYFVEGVLSEYFVLLALGVGISLSAAIFLRMLMSVPAILKMTHWASRGRPFAPWLKWVRGFDLLAHAEKMARFYKVAVPVALLIIVVGWAAGRGQLGIDFTGGAMLVVELPEGSGEVSVEDVRGIADEVFDARTEVQDAETDTGARHLTIRVPDLEEQKIGGDASVAEERDRQTRPLESELIKALDAELGLDEKVKLVASEQLGSAAAVENTLSSLSNVAWGFLVLTILCAILYVSVTVPFWVVVALVVDMILVLAVITISGIPVDYAMIAAFLTFAGYSINDSIVVCHSIKALGKPHMDEFVDANDPELAKKIRTAISKGLEPLASRVFLTSFTTMLTMLPLLFLGEGVLRAFGLIFVAGTAVGTLSSVYIVGVNAGDVVMGDTQTLDGSSPAANMPERG